jgi:UDP-glucose 4-epimerase
VLVTGGAGFIGSHTCVELLEHGYDVVVVDDFSNSFPAALLRVEKTAGRSVVLHEGDIRNPGVLHAVLAEHDIDTVIHFAAKKAVGESMEIPLEYYEINVTGTVNLLTAMTAAGVNRLVFSSSCSIYGDADPVPLAETAPARPANPYARTKWMCEQLLSDTCARYPELQVIALRYFNPIGAHGTGLLGEDPRGLPHNLVPYLTQVAIGRLPELRIFGSDYPTPDGTCVRDYLHVVDVADGHRVAMEHLDDATGLRIRNLGTGVGTSVTELVAAFEQASGRTIPVRRMPRRPGDVPRLVADPALVAAEWGWRTRYDVARMCRDAWAFGELNPMGYGE